jgi:voltage-gated sodium channel
MIQRIRELVDHKHFQLTIFGIILLNAVLMGIETSSTVMARYGGLLHIINWIIQGIFVTEIALRMAAYWPRVGRYFRDGWNVFDFTIVAVSLLPVAGPFAGVARLARVMRLVRIVSVSGQLRLIINTMLRSIPALTHVVILLSVLIYVYAIFGFYSFRFSDPLRWGTLGHSLLSVFQMLTLEGWIDMQAAVLDSHRWAWVYFASFVVLAVFVVVNLFIAVVLNNLEEVKAEQQEADDVEQQLLAGPTDPHQMVARIRTELDDLELLLRSRHT